MDEEEQGQDASAEQRLWSHLGVNFYRKVMIATRLFWIDGPWLGKLALAARPRGGDWLADEMAAWRQAGVGTVLSLLTEEEEAALGLTSEAAEVRAHEMTYRSFPIEDRQVPRSPSELAKALEGIEADLNDAKNVVVHCRQGVGRSGLVGACLMIAKGLDAKTALDRISESRGIQVPETAEQRQWILTLKDPMPKSSR